MRLIDADKLIARFKQLKGPDILMNLFISDVIKVIKQMPTAYDIDKVVEKFDKKYNNSLWIKGNEEFSITRNELIEIVKHSGAADDVCKWELDGVYLISPHKPLVSCVNEENYRYYYCPVCGKKIKVVE